MNKAVCKMVSGETFTISGGSAEHLYELVLMGNKMESLIMCENVAINFKYAVSIKFENEEAE
ncbi:hypothetical protein R7M47_05245 [Bacillus inaquosorum]|uniref:hypothetical protein n=1 Tax=Bacillus inaquosorum TaxID=483913 RepID=UPI00389A0F14